MLFVGWCVLCVWMGTCCLYGDWVRVVFGGCVYVYALSLCILGVW